MHIYGSEPGISSVGIYAPAGGGKPFSRESVAPGESSYGIKYAKLGDARDVTLVISHVSGYTNPGKIVDRTLIGNNGGPGGNTKYYVHSHLAILDSKGRNISFYDAFCRKKK